MPGPHAIEVDHVSRRFGDVTALDAVSLAIRPGEFFSLLGPSGCGKTTLLRVIAGLDAADSGTVRIDGADATEIPAHRRPVNTVFQSYALFPHLSVADNVAFGLRMKRVPAPEIAARTQRVMALVEIEPLARRRPAELSGGQKQRVALARAIVNEPKVLLLDEPLAALDLKLRKQLQLELRQLQRQLGITFVYVTHDQDEALVLSDRLAVLREGRIEQLGDARTLYERPRTRFVSQFLGTCSLLEGPVRESRPDGLVVATAIGDLLVTTTSAPRDRSHVALAIRPEKVRLSAAHATPAPNTVRVRVDECLYVGAESQYTLCAGTQVLRATVMNDGPSQGLVGGTAGELHAHLPPEALVVLED